MPVDDPPLVLVNVFAERVKNGRWVNECREWAIRTPRAKLLAKYASGTSALFGHYVYCFPNRESNRITPIDIEAADRLMGANISAQSERLATVHKACASAEFQSTLASIHPEANILDETHDSAACAAIAALTSHPGIGLSIATKLLSIKRPKLIPMMDSVVQRCFNSREPGEILAAFRRLLATPSIAVHANELARAIVSAVGFEPTPLRVLDELIWFDWNLEPGASGILRVVGFPEWVYETDCDERGVHRVQATSSRTDDLRKF